MSRRDFESIGDDQEEWVSFLHHRNRQQKGTKQHRRRHFPDDAEEIVFGKRHKHRRPGFEH